MADSSGSGDQETGLRTEIADVFGSPRRRECNQFPFQAGLLQPAGFASTFDWQPAGKLNADHPGYCKPLPSVLILNNC
jgi:hypothetical protein